MLDVTLLAAAVVATARRSLDRVRGRAVGQIAYCKACKAAHRRIVVGVRERNGVDRWGNPTYTSERLTLLDGRDVSWSPTWSCTATSTVAGTTPSSAPRAASPPPVTTASARAPARTTAARTGDAPAVDLIRYADLKSDDFAPR